MPKFVFAYHGGAKPESEEDVAKVMGAWKAWMGGMSDAIVDMGNPVGLSKTVSSSGVADNGGSNPLGGYTLVKADDIDKAVALAQGCPILDSGGSVEVAEAIEMNM